MPPAKRRKIEPASDQQESTPQQGVAAASSSHISANPQDSDNSPDDAQTTPSNSKASLPDKNQERRERFKALQARAVSYTYIETWTLRQKADFERSKTLQSVISRKLQLNRNGWRLILISSPRSRGDRLLPHIIFSKLIPLLLVRILKERELGTGRSMKQRNGTREWRRRRNTERM